MLKIEPLLGKKIKLNECFKEKVYFYFIRSYSNTRKVAPATNRALRSPGAALKSSDTMRSHDTNPSSTESSRHPSRPIGVPTTTTSSAKNQPTTTTAATTDVTLSTTPNDIYQHVYHDDSSTHGSRTLDSRFSRDKYDLSGGSTDEDEDHEEEQNIPKQSPEKTQKPMNGSPPSPPPSPSLPPPPSPPPPPLPAELPSQEQPSPPRKSSLVEKAMNEIEQSINSKRENELVELDKSKSPGIEKIVCKRVHDDEEEEAEEEEDNSESNHKKENRVSVEIYHNDTNKNSKNEETIDQEESLKRYSSSLKMYLNTRHTTGGSHSICITPNVVDLIKKQEEEEQQKLLIKRSQQQQRSYSLQIERTVSVDFTHSPSSSESSLLEPPNVERLIGSKDYDENNEEYLRKTTTPPMVVEIRSKPHSLPRMTNYIEYIDKRTLPPIDSLSWQDDTISNDQIAPLYEKESPEDSMELARQVIESILTQIDEEERQLLNTVDRLVEQACSRALSLYIMECRAQLFAGSSHIPHHKSCILRSVETDKDNDNDNEPTTILSRLRTKSSPVIAVTTDWTDISRRLAAQTCFAAFPSGNNIHELDRADFSTFSEAKLKFFNIINNDAVVPSQSSVSLPPLLPLSTSVPNVVSSSSSTRSSRASSVSSYASSMHVPCPPVLDSNFKRYQRPLSARLLDLSDDSDSNPTASISTSLKTCIIPTTVSNPNPSFPPPVRAQRRLQQQQKRRSTEDLNSSSDDSLSNHLNKAAGYRSVFVQRSHHNK